jgi:hypothetical protein
MISLIKIAVDIKRLGRRIENAVTENERAVYSRELETLRRLLCSDSVSIDYSPLCECNKERF